MIRRPPRSTLFPTRRSSDLQLTCSSSRDDRTRPSCLGPMGRRHRERSRFSSERKHVRSEEHTSELQSRPHLVCRLLLEKKKKTTLSFSGYTCSISSRFVSSS